MHPAISAALLDALAILLPVTCAGCGLDDRALCAACRQQLVARPSVHRLADGTAVHSALRYEGAVRKTVLSLKEQGRTDVARALASPLAVALSAGASEGDATNTLELVAVPGSRSGYRRRGYDPVRLLLRRSGLPSPARVLRNTGDRVAQKTLDIDERSVNLTGSMRAVRPLPNRRFIIVDDVLTTGATLAEAARALRAAGAEVAYCSTLAFTPRYFPNAA